MPGPGGELLETIINVIKEPALRWMPAGLWHEYRHRSPPASDEDESVYDFLHRRLGTTKAPDMVASAVLHGIYAGDITQLSAKSLLPVPWFCDHVHGGIIRGTNAAGGGHFWIDTADEHLLRNLRPKIEPTLLDGLAQSSVYSFKDGIGTITTALQKSLLANPKVKFQTGVGVKSLAYDIEADKMKVRLESSSFSQLLLTTTPRSQLRRESQQHIIAK